MRREERLAGKARAADAATLDLRECRRVAIEAAEAAGRLVRGAFREVPTVEEKSATGDVVTSLDRVAERLIIDRLRAHFPSHGIVSEESGVSHGCWVPLTWLIDPLDGSNNIAVGLPVAAIGLALCRDNQPVVGVVHEPFVSRTWSAEHDRGVWQADGEPLRRQSGSTRRPVVAWTQGYGVSARDAAVSALRLALKGYARRVLELWAPLCAWAMLARGDIDGIIAYRVGELDLHAGALIAGMTGIEIRSLDGSPFESRFRGLAESRSLVAAPPERMGELLALIPGQASEPAE
jgi:myo-inositol-1(or 4)-monophosphatase